MDILAPQLASAVPAVLFDGVEGPLIEVPLTVKPGTPLQPPAILVAESDETTLNGVLLALGRLEAGQGPVSTFRGLTKVARYRLVASAPKYSVCICGDRVKDSVQALQDPSKRRNLRSWKTVWTRSKEVRRRFSSANRRDSSKRRPPCVWRRRTLDSPSDSQ